MNSTRPRFFFAPGAGAGSSHPWMRHWADLLGSVGTVHPLDYPYLLENRKRPDPLPTLIEAHAAALSRLRSSSKGAVILIGKSMGSRVGCHVSLTEPVSGLVCLGYPLCGGGDPTKLRDRVLRELATPVLFVQGTRDPLCPLDLLEPIRRQMKAPSELLIVEEGDHSLAVTKRWLNQHQETQAEVDQRILGAVQKFTAAVA